MPPVPAAKSPARTVAYVRVSTEDQELDSQRLEILDFAHRHRFRIDEFLELEISSRKTPKARRIDELLEGLRPGDRLIVSELSRLGRSVGEVVRIVDEAVKKQVEFISIKDNIHINGEKDLQGTVMVTLFGLFAEVERHLISERTKRGLAAARSRGKVLGRPRGSGRSKLDPHRMEIEGLLKNGSTKAFIAKRYETSEANLHQWIRKHGISGHTPSRSENQSQT